MMKQFRSGLQRGGFFSRELMGSVFECTVPAVKVWTEWEEQQSLLVSALVLFDQAVAIGLGWRWFDVSFQTRQIWWVLFVVGFDVLS
jgi:hypothetical protein